MNCLYSSIKTIVALGARMRPITIEKLYDFNNYFCKNTPISDIRNIDTCANKNEDFIEKIKSIYKAGNTNFIDKISTSKGGTLADLYIIGENLVIDLKIKITMALNTIYRYGKHLLVI